MEKEKNIKSAKAKTKEIDLDKYYKTPGAPSVRSLDFGLWFATRRKMFLRLVVIILVVLSASFFAYSGYQYVVYFLSGQSNANLMTSNPVASVKNQIVDLNIGAPQLFSNPTSHDLAVKIKNPNDKFLARFNYCFYQGGEEKSCQAGFIFPGEEKYFLALGLTLNSATDISLALKDLRWQRINAHLYPDWNNYYLTHRAFSTSEISFNETESTRGDLNNLEFSLANSTPYDYWAVPFNILIFSGSKLIGVNTYTAKEFLSQEKRPVKLSWSGRLGSASTVKIEANLDIVSPDIYFKKP